MIYCVRDSLKILDRERLKHVIYLPQLDTGNTDITVPDIKLEMFPKEAFTAGMLSRALKWLLARSTFLLSSNVLALIL